MPAGVTTLYFETEREDDLHKVGYSKAETTTIIPIVEAFQAAYGIEELVVVAGRRHAVSIEPECVG